MRMLIGFVAAVLLTTASRAADPGIDGIDTALPHVEASFIVPQPETCPAPCDMSTSLDDTYLAVSRTTFETPAGEIAFFNKTAAGWVQTFVLPNPCPPSIPPGGFDPLPCQDPILGRDLALDGQFILASAERADASVPREVHVFRRSGDAWIEHQRLALPLPERWDVRSARIEHIVANDKLAVVSADYSGFNNGLSAHLEIVYVLRRGANKQYHLEAQLLSDVPSEYAGFGTALAIDTHTLVVGAPYEMNYTGAVYVFGRGASWERRAKVTSSGATEQEFGGSVALSGRTLIVGAPTDFEEGSARVGIVYVFSKQAGQWIEEQTLRDPLEDADVGPPNFRYFGNQLSLDKNHLVVGVSQAFSQADPLLYAWVKRGGRWMLAAEFAETQTVTHLQISKRNLVSMSAGVRFGGSTAVYELPLVCAKNADGL